MAQRHPKDVLFCSFFSNSGLRVGEARDGGIVNLILMRRRTTDCENKSKWKLKRESRDVVTREWQHILEARGHMVI